MKLNEEPFDLRSCVSEVVAMLTLAAQEKNLCLTEHILPEVPLIIVGDQARLKQVLTNLVGNAIKFTDQGGIDVSVSSTDDTLAFAITDSGIGIPEDKQHLLFQSFSQVGNSLQHPHTGTGLGLAISKGLVELMGGTIGMRNREGGGSVFCFSLPLKCPDTEHTPKSTLINEKETSSARPVRILLAEDEPMVREIVTLVLNHHGWQVETAVNGREALAKWQNEPFDIILMDLQMPEVNGLEATRSIRAGESESGRRIPIIGFTANASATIAKECIKTGMDYILSKPLHFDDLSEMINKLLAE